MSDYLLTQTNEIVDFRRTINSIRSRIEYDIVNHPHNTEFEELEVLLNDAVHKLDEIHDKIKDHVYAYDVTVTVTKRVYVLSADECDAEQAAMDYAVGELDCAIDWTEDDVSVERQEDEETTTVYDVEV